MTELYPYQIVPQDWDQFFQQEKSDCVPKFQTFYKQPLLNSKQTVEQTEFAALDIETTGLNAQEDEIVSIGLVPFNSRRIYIGAAKYWLVRSQQLTSDSVVIHGLTHSEVNQAPSLSEALPQLMEAMAGKQIVVHYRYMEREFFRQAASNKYQQNFLFPVIDTLEIEAHFLRKQQSLLAKWAGRQLPSLRLPNIRPRYQLPDYENHNALTDALATAELLQAQIQYQNLQTMPVRKLWK